MDDSYILDPIPASSSPTRLLHRLVPREPEPVEISKLPYQDARKVRRDTHECFKEFLREFLDSELPGIVMDVADSDDQVVVRQMSNATGKRVRGLGYRGGLQVIGRIGMLVNWLEKADG